MKEQMSNINTFVELKLREQLEKQYDFFNRKSVSIDTSEIQVSQHKRSENEDILKLVNDTIEVPRINGLKHIAGLWEVKRILKTLIFLPRSQPQLFANGKVCNSLLLFGPPGTGKTQLVHALAYESKMTLHSVSVSNILSPMVGQSEK